MQHLASLCHQLEQQTEIHTECLRSSPFTKVYRFVHEGKAYIYKSFLNRSWVEGLKSFIRGNRAERALKGHLLLEKHGFGVPKAILQGKNYQGENFLVMEAVEPCIRLDRFLSGAEGQEYRSSLIQEFAYTIGRLHACHISHGDLRWGNILVRPKEQGVEYFFIDNERTVQYRKLPDRKRLKNLVQLNLVPREASVTAEEKKLFFELYAKHNPTVFRVKEDWANKIATQTAFRWAKKQKSK